MNEPRYNPALHTIALLTACATFPLIFMGGLVTSHGAGMAVIDWPNSAGYNMFLFPPNQWVGGILYEHTHRLMGTVVGFLAVTLVSVAFGWAKSLKVRSRARQVSALSLLGAIIGTLILKVTHQSLHSPFWHGVIGLTSLAAVMGIVSVCRSPEPRAWVRKLTVGVLIAVLLQGSIGGLRVLRINLDLAIIHACVAQAFFCLAAFTVVGTSRWWLQAPDLSLANPSAGRALLRLASLAVVVIYLQLVAGAVMRHYRAGLAIPDLPLVYGRMLPPIHRTELAAINRFRAAQPAPPSTGSDMDFAIAEQLAAPVTLAQIWTHFAHRVGAILVTFAVGSLIVYILARHRHRGLVFPAILLIVLLSGQLTLGVLTVVLRKPADVTSLHVAVGALTLLTTFVLLVRANRLFRSRNQVKSLSQGAGRDGPGIFSSSPISGRRVSA